MILSPVRKAVRLRLSTVPQVRPSALVHTPGEAPDGSFPAASQRPPPPTTMPTVVGAFSCPTGPATSPSRQVAPPSEETRNNGRGTGLVRSLPTATMVDPVVAMALSTWL